MNLYLWPNPKGYAPALAGLPVMVAIGPWDLCGGTAGAYTPDPAKAEAAGKALVAKGAKECVVEVEPSAGPLGNYGPAITDDDAKANAKKLAEGVLAPFAQGLQGVVGFYGYPLQHTSWGYVGDMFKAEGKWGTKLHRWQKRNDLLGDFILPYLGQLNPELYIRHDKIPEQQASTLMMTTETYRKSDARLIRPVIWHRRQAHLPSKQFPQYSPLSVREILAYLKGLSESTDSVVAYTSSNHTPADDAGPGTELLGAWARGEL